MSEQLELEVEQSGHRLDQFVAEGAQLSRATAQRLIEGGAVLVNGRRRNKNYRVEEEDLVAVTLPDPVALEALPQQIPIDLVYEDGHLLVLNKERGMVVHPAAGNPDGTLVNALLHHCGESLSGINGVLRPGIVHRIDKNTSGLLMVAKTDEAHRNLAAQLQLHSIDREYFAVAHGRFRQPEGRIEAPIGRHPTRRKEMAVVQDGRPACTIYTVQEELPGFSLVRCRLTTGRTHQIRVHLSHLGHPVAGDPVYGPASPALPGGQCLHAAVLGFTHPVSGERLRFEAPLPGYFIQFLEQLSS